MLLVRACRLSSFARVCRVPRRCYTTAPAPEIKSHALRSYLGSLFAKSSEISFPSHQHNNLQHTPSSCVARTTNPKINADYQFTQCFQLARSMNMPPGTVAQTLIDHLPSNKIIQQVSFSPPGFINISVRNDYLEDVVASLSSDGLPYPSLPSPPRPPIKVLVDYASPNMSKELHVGHLRSIVLGESLSRIQHYVGNEVERVSHVGDFGTPMGLVIAHAMDNNAPWLSSALASDGTYVPEHLPSPTELGALYAAAKARSKTDKLLDQRAIDFAAILQRAKRGELGDDPSHHAIYRAWLIICEASRRGFNKIFETLDVHVQERGESTYAPLLPNVVAELHAKGVSTISEGAHCVFLQGFPTPLIIQKKDGSHLYATTDLAALRSRIEQGHKWIIYVTDDTQKQHFQMVIQTAQQAGWLDPAHVRVDHVMFGVVKGSDGKKLSSRDGSPATLNDLLTNAVKEARKATMVSKSLTRSEVIEEASSVPSSSSDIVGVSTRAPSRLLDSNEADTDQPATSLGLGALKYYDLAQRSNDYIFSYDSMLAFKGNTAVYILYAYTRIRTLVKRASDQPHKQPAQRWVLDGIDTKQQERSLGLHLARFPEVVLSAQQGSKPSLICDYLFELASDFHSFYDEVKIIGSPRQSQRIHLCMAVANVLKKGMHLLGIQSVERM